VAPVHWGWDFGSAPSRSVVEFRDGQVRAGARTRAQTSEDIVPKLAIEIIDTNHHRALKPAARSMHLTSMVERHGQSSVRIVHVQDAHEAYLLGVETIKRWRAFIGRTS
jgi:hypothetical protein